MADTLQDWGHVDEARHFYVFRDYLRATLSAWLRRERTPGERTPGSDLAL